MTTPFDNTESVAVLRKRWWNRYLSVQTKYDVQIRTALIQAAQDAQERLSALENNSTFSAGVRTAQVRIAMKEINSTYKDLFKTIILIIQKGHKDEALAAVAGLNDTDLRYLKDAFGNTGDVNSYIRSLEHTATLNVTHAIQRIQKTDIPLSRRVYRTEALSKRWVQNSINSALIRGDSARELAKTVRQHILPTTPGGTSYAALRLGRTELNNAFHATAITTSQDRPWVTGMRWYVSDTHKHDPTKIEVCSQLNGQVFPVDKVPGKPHPQCRCFAAPEVESITVFKQNLTAGYYRDWIENAA